MDRPQPKLFNTTGVCIPSEHYMLPVLPRIPNINGMLDNKYYFVIYGPRQSGKTTFLQSLIEKIHLDGNYYALSCSLQTLISVTDESIGINRIANLINDSVMRSQAQALKALAYPEDMVPGLEPALKIRKFLNYLSVNLDKDLVVIFDEADSLSGPILLTFLSQIRDGYLERNISPVTKFPRSLALVGMMNIRDYKAQIRPESKSLGSSSPFNIIEEAFTLANFTKNEISELYNQHTEATGQIFTEKSIETAWRWSEGQPWLVNALAKDVVNRQLNDDFSVAIEPEHFDQAAENLLRRRDTHLDSLLRRLHEPRLRRVMEPIILGAKSFSQEVTQDDTRYALELGLIKIDEEGYKPANPLYQEAIIRYLSRPIQDGITENYGNRWLDGKKLDMSGLLKGFQQFWRENAEMRTHPLEYHESTPHLVFFAFMQRVINGGVATLQREYALGRDRLDTNIKYQGVSYPVELKVKSTGLRLSDAQFKGIMVQLGGYMDKLGATEGWLIVFVKNEKKSWKEKIYWETRKFKHLTIHIVGC
jgi:GTPase SAR1 family protein